MKAKLTKRSEGFQFEVNVGTLKELTDEVATLVIKQVMDHEPATAFFKSKVPKGKTREVVIYSDELAAEYLALQKAALEKVFTDVSITVSQRVKGPASFDEEIEIVSRHESAGDLEDWLKTTIRFAGAIHGDDNEFNVEMLKAVKAFKQAVIKASMNKL